MKNQITSVVLFILCLTSVNTIYAKPISIEQIESDISYLASDAMKGRGNFSPEIAKAADYIAQRFKGIGLKAPQEYPDYKQTFKLYLLKSENVSLTLNETSFAADDLLGFTKNESLTFNDQTDTKITTIGLGDDFRAAISSANSAGGNHLFLVHPTHKQMFSRYQNFMKSGRPMLDIEAEGALIAVLTDITDVDTVNGSITMNISSTSVSNVIGVIPGKSDEQIIFSAHYDHLGALGDDIYNGADDNASGVTAVLGLAQYYATKAQPERTLVFIGFGAEEEGILGSEYYTRTIDADAVVAMINMEMVGTESAFGAGKVWMTGSDRSDLRDLMNQSLDEAQHIEADPYAKFNLFYRSDNASLARLGVPAHSFSSTEIDKIDHYHKPNDDMAVININSLYQSTLLLAKATESLANGIVTPVRVEPIAARARGKIY